MHVTGDVFVNLQNYLEFLCMFHMINLNQHFFLIASICVGVWVRVCLERVGVLDQLITSYYYANNRLSNRVKHISRWVNERHIFFYKFIVRNNIVLIIVHDEKICCKIKIDSFLTFATTVQWSAVSKTRIGNNFCKISALPFS